MNQLFPFKPVGAKILVRHLQATQEGLIFIPEKINDTRRTIHDIPAFKAEVVSVGNLSEKHNIKNIQPGSIIYVNPYSGTEIRLGTDGRKSKDGTLYVLYLESDILGLDNEEAQ